MVYFLTCACVDYYAALLPLLTSLRDAPLQALHGKMVGMDMGCRHGHGHTHACVRSTTWPICACPIYI